MKNVWGAVALVFSGMVSGIVFLPHIMAPSKKCAGSYAMLDSDNQPKKECESQKECLVCVRVKNAKDKLGPALTSGENGDFKEYCDVKNCLEEIRYSYVREYSSNVKIILNRSQNSLRILDAFRKSNLFDWIKLVQVKRGEQGVEPLSSILYCDCFFTEVKINCDAGVVEFFFICQNRIEEYVEKSLHLQ